MDAEQETRVVEASRDILFVRKSTAIFENDAAVPFGGSGAYYPRDYRERYIQGKLTEADLLMMKIARARACYGRLR